MKKRLLFINALFGGLILSASAQEASVTKNPLVPGTASRFDLSGTVSSAASESGDPSRVTSCTDKVTYVDRNAATTAYGHLGGNLGFVAFAQYFEGYAGQVTKIDFQASCFTAGTETVNVVVANNSTGTSLATGTASVTGATSANCSVTFASPANVPASANGFVVLIILNSTTDSVKIYANTSGGGTDYSTAITATTETSLADYGFDRDLLIRPTIKFNTVNPDLTATPTTVCTGASVNFNATYASSLPEHYFSDIFNPDGVDFDLDYGDGASSSSAGSSSHAYATAGTKTANLEIIYLGWTADCTSDPSTETITVNPAPFAFFSWDATGLSVVFTNLSAGATSYGWVFGDGGTASAPSPVHNYASNGTYTVELNATGSCGTDQEFTNITISSTTNGGNVGIVEARNGLTTNIYPNPASNLLNVDLSLTTTQDVSVQVISPMGQVVYSKELGSILSSLQTIDLSAFESGVYFIRVVHNNTVSSRSFVKQ